MAFCGKCGSKITDNAKFCACCGAPVNSKMQNPQKGAESSFSSGYKKSEGKLLYESKKDRSVGVTARILLSILLAIGGIFVICIVGSQLFTEWSGSDSYEKQLAASWYAEGSNSPSFTLYSDGTCKIDGEYGTGKWSVVNEDQLKLTNFYGESMVVTIVSIKDGCLTISSGGENTAQMWNSPQK